jgi:hypothetical protein
MMGEHVAAMMDEVACRCRRCGRDGAADSASADACLDRLGF